MSNTFQKYPKWCLSLYLKNLFLKAPCFVFLKNNGFKNNIFKILCFFPIVTLLSRVIYCFLGGPPLLWNLLMFYSLTQWELARNIFSVVHYSSAFPSFFIPPYFRSIIFVHFCCQRRACLYCMSSENMFLGFLLTFQVW